MAQWTHAGIITMVAEMEQRKLRGFRVSPATAPLVIDALKHFAREHFGETRNSFQVDVWTAEFGRIEYRFADICDMDLASLAYEKAVERAPHNVVTLRQGAQILDKAAAKEFGSYLASIRAKSWLQKP